jgi:hypothetical protein
LGLGFRVSVFPGKIHKFLDILRFSCNYEEENKPSKGEPNI